MDGLSIALTVTTLIAVTSQAVSLFTRFSDAFRQDNQFSTIYYNLRIENQKTNAWAKRIQMQLQPGQGLESVIPSDSLVEVNKILMKLKTTYELVEMKLRSVRYDPKKDRSQRAFFNKLRWLLVGYDEPKQMVKLLKSLNEYLNLIAPVLPGYTSIEPYSVPGPPTTAEIVPTIAMQPQPLETNEGANDDQKSEVEDEDTQLDFNLLLDRHISTKAVFDACVRTLKSLEKVEAAIVLPSGQTLRAQASLATRKLQTWGIGMFTGPLALDHLFDCHGKRARPLRQAILKLLVRIAATGGMCPSDYEAHVLAHPC